MIEIRTPAAPVETVTPIKPSEALRLGRLIRPVESGCGETLFADENRACGLGAMAIGYGFDPAAHLKDPTRAYAVVAGRTGWTFHCGDGFGPDGSLQAVWARFDKARGEGKSGDAAVLAYLAERGL